LPTASRRSRLAAHWLAEYGKRADQIRIAVVSLLQDRPGTDEVSRAVELRLGTTQ
jgi:hypothetical protein